jgi:glycogen debranching enzyme
MDRDGDRDGDGFVEYGRRSRDGLQNQGWKDSEDSIFHADGTLAEGPIALCEVQAYVYGAKRGASRLATVVGERERSRALLGEARLLRSRFEAAFWCEDLETYAIALDGDKRPCRVRSSNAGHCLFTGIASPTRARLVAATLTHPDMFSGWGVRTIASDARRYNPMSYHNGSVWPHDNAIIAAGMGRYHLSHQAEKILQGLYDACQWVDLQRLPELVCGFARVPGAGPTLYPVACAPQAWSAGAVYMLLAACLGIAIDGAEQRVRFDYPRLPGFLETVWISGLRVGEALVDLELRRHGDDVGVNVLRRDGDVEVVLVK